MVSVSKIENTKINPGGNLVLAELRGLSTDEKPTEINRKKIDNGSIFIEIDTGNIFFYDLENEEWKGV